MELEDICCCGCLVEELEEGDEDEQHPPVVETFKTVLTLQSGGWS